MSLLTIKNLSVEYQIESGPVLAVDKASFEINPNETVALLGHSGSGKSTVALSILRLIVSPGKIIGGEIRFNGENLLTIPDEALRKVRGGEIAMLFQDPFTTLNPVFTIGDQIRESLKLHRNLSGKAAQREASDLLGKVRFDQPEKWLKAYPHELSGGMRQRAVLAMALAGKPKLLIADEPTTALDSTIQFEVLKLLKEIQATFGLSILLITHNEKVARWMSRKLIRMEKGKILDV